MATKPHISLVIPVLNEESTLGDCLKAIHDQTLRPYEVIVVDGHSEDRTVGIAHELGAVVLYENAGTRGAACQVGLSHASGDYVAFTDADCRPAPDWLARLAASLIDGDNRGIVGVGSRIVHEGADAWEKAIAHVMNTTLGSGGSIQGRQHELPRFVKSISGSSSLYPREVLVEIGGFNQKLPTCEDTELNHRLISKGRLLYDPGTYIRHSPKRGPVAFARRMFQYGFGRALSRVPGVQVIPPLTLLTVSVLGLVLPLVALLTIAAYLLLLLGHGARAFVETRNRAISWRVPIILMVEHLMYSAGFLRGLLSR